MIIMSEQVEPRVTLTVGRVSVLSWACSSVLDLQSDAALLLVTSCILLGGVRRRGKLQGKQGVLWAGEELLLMQLKQYNMYISYIKRLITYAGMVVWSSCSSQGRCRFLEPRNLNSFFEWGIFFFLSAALVRLFIACSVYLFILFALGRASVYPLPVHAWGSVC